MELISHSSQPVIVALASCSLTPGSALTMNTPAATAFSSVPAQAQGSPSWRDTPPRNRSRKGKGRVSPCFGRCHKFCDVHAAAKFGLGESIVAEPSRRYSDAVLSLDLQLQRLLDHQFCARDMAGGGYTPPELGRSQRTRQKCHWTIFRSRWPYAGCSGLW